MSRPGRLYDRQLPRSSRPPCTCGARRSALAGFELRVSGRCYESACRALSRTLSMALLPKCRPPAEQVRARSRFARQSEPSHSAPLLHARHTYARLMSPILARRWERPPSRSESRTPLATTMVCILGDCGNRVRSLTTTNLTFEKNKQYGKASGNVAHPKPHQSSPCSAPRKPH